MGSVLGLLGATLVSTGSAQAASVTVVVEGIEPARGGVFVTLCQGGLSGQACRIGEEAPGDRSSRAFSFAGVPPGRWAIAAYQDINQNGRLDRTPLGLPLEPYGFSGGSGHRARPDFADASFALREPGASVRVRLVRALPAR